MYDPFRCFEIINPHFCYNLNCFPNNLNILSVEEDEEEEEEHETYKTKKAPLREGPKYQWIFKLKKNSWFQLVIGCDVTTGQLQV